MSAGSTVIGRRLANRPRPLRSANSACSGRTVASGLSHFGPPHGAEEHGVGVAARLDVLGPDRHPVGVDGDPADDQLHPVEREPERAAGGLEHPDGARDDLRPDAVARDQRDPVAEPGLAIGHGSSSAVRRPTNATSIPLISAPWSLLAATR